MWTRDLVPLATRLISNLLNMHIIQVAVVLVHWCGKGNLMDLIFNQLHITGVVTMQLVGITSILMSLFSVTSMVFMKVRSHKNFLIPHFHLALCSLSKSPHLRNSFLSPEASLSLLVPILYLFLTCIVPTIYLSLEQILCFPLFLPPSHNSTMPRERGKPK
jgi:hypothetical protein